jgi:hypothetical protein
MGIAALLNVDIARRTFAHVTHNAAFVQTAVEHFVAFALASWDFR